MSLSKIDLYLIDYLRKTYDVGLTEIENYNKVCMDIVSEPQKFEESFYQDINNRMLKSAKFRSFISKINFVFDGLENYNYNTPFFDYVMSEVDSEINRLSSINTHQTKLSDALAYGIAKEAMFEFKSFFIEVHEEAKIETQN